MAEMNVSHALFGFLIFFTPEVAIGQLDNAASKAADAYLNALKLVDIPEGRAILSELDWGCVRQYPAFAEVRTLYESMFATDVAGVQGYKRLLEVEAISMAGTLIHQRVVIISYQDKTTKKWKVYDVGKASENTEFEWRAAQKRLGDTKYVEDQINYRSYGYWSMMDGKVRQAQGAFERAAQLNRRSTKLLHMQADFDCAVEATKRIVGNSVNR